MKRLDELTREDLLEEHDRMMGIVDDGLMEGFDYFSNQPNPHEMLEIKELYDELDRSESEAEREAEGRERSSDALRQPHYWKDKRTPVEIRARVWRSTGPHPRKLTED